MRLFPVLVGVAFTTCSVSVYPQQAPDPADGGSRQELVTRYCVTCHNDRAKAGGLSLDGMSVAGVAEHPRVWETVVQKIRGDLMPPPGRPRPERAAARDLVTYLEASLDRAAEERPDPGRTEALHRLNRAEYRNAVRDLLSLDIDVSAMLPADDVSYGFDNIAGVQRMSPTLMERYLAAAQKIGSVAVGASPRAASTETFLVPPELQQNDRLEELPFGTRGGTVVRYTFPRDGVYSIRVQLTRYAGASFDEVPVFDQPQRLELSVDGTPMHVFEMPPAVHTEGRGYSGANRRRSRCRLAGTFSRESGTARRRAHVSEPDTGTPRESARAVRKTRSRRTQRLLHDAEGRVPSQCRDQRTARIQRRGHHAEPAAYLRLSSVEGGRRDRVRPKDRLGARASRVPASRQRRGSRNAARVL